jgi:hypothetical protein
MYLDGLASTARASVDSPRASGQFALLMQRLPHSDFECLNEGGGCEISKQASSVGRHVEDYLNISINMT